MATYCNLYRFRFFKSVQLQCNEALLETENCISKQKYRSIKIFIDFYLIIFRGKI